MSKGSRPRKIKNRKQFELNWDSIFGRKKTPKHGATQLHADKTKKIPREDKYHDIDLEGIQWDSDFEEQSRELYGDNMPDVKDVKHFRTYPDGGDID
jgi:hypothetical protein|tara:strand:- start:3200 stop:3490 length:291 start_codon:yes stop_codon:yes gene_type:complete